MIADLNWGGKVRYHMGGVEKRGHSPQAFPNPALRKEREGRATHCVADSSEVKSLGHLARTV